MPQNTRTQTRTSAYSVRKLATITTAATAVGPTPASAPAWSSCSLATKPAVGGRPASVIAGMANSTARAGEVFRSPPIRSSATVPVRRTIRPLTRNSVASTVMWWAA